MIKRRIYAGISSGTLRATYQKLEELGIGASMRDDIAAELLLRDVEDELTTATRGVS